MLELNGNTLHFSFPEVHPDAKLSITFERTCRIPDDGSKYPLPGTLGHFPLKHVDDYRKRVPHDWEQRGGIMLPMYQSEAMWINFSPGIVRDRRYGGTVKYPFAVKVASGKQSAITGKPWSDKLRKDDYMVTPPQQWLDGFVVDEGLIRQFVAMPLGMGTTVEEQLTGEVEWGGLQFEVMPMKAEAFERHFPKVSPPPRDGINIWSGRIGTRSSRKRARRSSQVFGAKGVPVAGGAVYSSQSLGAVNSADFSRGVDGMRSEKISEISEISDSVAVSADMGLGAGGSMKQDIKKDPYDKKDWKKKADGRRCYIHLANSLAWQAITGERPPTAPPTAQDYKRMGLPWFDLYEDDLDAVKGKAALKGVKSVLEFGFQHGVPTLPENKSVKIKRVNMLQPGKPSKKHKKTAAVREGDWAQ